MVKESVSVQSTTDPNMHVYHVRIPLTEEVREDGSAGGVSELGAFGKLIVEIPGVEVVRIQKYRFFVSKANMFAWDEIDEPILSIVRELVLSQRLLNEDFSGCLKKIA